MIIVEKDEVARWDSRVDVSKVDKSRDCLDLLRVLYSTCQREPILFRLGMDSKTEVCIPCLTARWYPNLARAHNRLYTTVREHEGIHTYVSACAAARGYPFLVRRYIRIDSIDTFADGFIMNLPSGRYPLPSTCTLPGGYSPDLQYTYTTR